MKSMKRTACMMVALAALASSTVAVPALAQDSAATPNATMQDQNNQNNGNNQNGNRRQRNRRDQEQSGNMSNRDNMSGMASTSTMTMQPVAPDFQRNIDRANQTLDNIVKLLDAIEARKAGTTPPTPAPGQ